VAGNAAEEFNLGFGDVALQSQVGSQEAEPDLIMDGGVAFGPGGDGNGLQEGECVGYFLTKGVEVAVVTTGRAEAVDLSLEGGELAGLEAGVGAELTGVLVAGLATAPALPHGRHDRRRGR